MKMRCVHQGGFRQRLVQSKGPVPQPGGSQVLVRMLASKSPELMRLGKAGFTRASDDGYRQGIAGAVNLAAMVASTEDSKEGLTAFVEKRKPVWR